ncbi:hypothetical protein IV203_014166 [Nitzschia inconspicua]|uniref:Uncharacterized protein n=1 Tax=Nitzschia inconspicua TaxID=303405 RepID=A0A9K3Q8M1_9STRA|nr:hypothetical protein IV203_028874 [Nitzschia inconspicua]KAG7375071.1 hypothetical protein IV203_014166 [Nitzschia inconspicua]
MHPRVVTTIPSVSSPDMPAGPAPTFPAATGVTELDQVLNNATVMNDDLIENHIGSHEEADEEKYDEEDADEEKYEVDNQYSTGVVDHTREDDVTELDESTGEDDVTEIGESTGVNNADYPKNT